MARGRMLNKRISLNKNVNSMSDRAQLMYTWSIAHLDKNGVIHGDPAVLKSIVIPRRQDVSVDDVEGYIREWCDARLVVWYEYDGDLWLWYPTFVDNQIGLRADREPDTGNPVCGSLPDECRIIAGSHPESIPPKVREENTNQEKRTERARDVVPTKWPAGSLEQTALITFMQTTPQFSDTEGNLRAIPELVRLASARGDPESVLPGMIELYSRLRAGEIPSMRDQKFWADQPFTPKAMLSLWERLEPKAVSFMAEADKQQRVNEFVYGDDEEDDDVSFG